MTPYQHAHNAVNGILWSSVAVISTLQEQVDWWIRITAGGLGIAIGAISLYRLLKHKVESDK